MTKKITTFLVFLTACISINTNTSLACEGNGSSAYVNRTMALGYNPIQALFGAHKLQLEYKMNDILSLTGAGWCN